MCVQTQKKDNDSCGKEYNFKLIEIARELSHSIVDFMAHVQFDSRLYGTATTLAEVHF